MSKTQAIAVTVFIETFDGKANKEIQSFHAIVDTVLAENGCLQYELTQSLQNENQFILLEKWASMADLEAHLQTSHMIQVIEQAKTFRSKSPEIMLTKAVD